jgi:hypothetical protein
MKTIEETNTMGYFSELSLGLTPTPRRLLTPAEIAHSQASQERTAMINFTRQDLNVVANRALAIVGSDKRWCDAINRAVRNLATGRFSYDGHVVMLHSSSSEAVYRIDVAEPMTCTCKGRARGYRCWHIVAARLIVRAAEHRDELDASAGVTYKGVYYSPEHLARAAEARMVAAQSAADALFN